MLTSLQQRRQGIVGDCMQVKTDVEVYNAHNRKLEQIPLMLDFTFEVAEAEVVDGGEAA